MVFLLLPKFTVLSSAGLRGSWPSGFGIVGLGEDPVNHTPGIAFGSELTVARHLHLDLVVTGSLELFQARQLRVTEGSFETF